MSDDLISRQAAIDIVFRSPFFSDSLTEELRALPSVQPKTGRWINIRPLLTAARCSECKGRYIDCNKHNYPCRVMTPKEMERLQTLPEGYLGEVNSNKAAKLAGNAWNVDTIVHILNSYKRVSEIFN